jgi:hypothetical protein
MNSRESALFAVTPRNVIGLSVLFLVLASILGLLNSQKMKTLHANVTNAQAARDAGEHRRVTQEQKIENGAITITLVNPPKVALTPLGHSCKLAFLLESH